MNPEIDKSPEPPGYYESLEEKTLPEYEDKRPKSTKTYGLPTVQQLVAHLKFLKALETLKAISTAQMSTSEDKKWPLYLTVAVRRFIIFISALRAKAKDVANLNEYMDRLNPPLDVLMVWHTFMLSPKGILHEFKAARFPGFIKYPFPLVRAAAAIDDKDFIYRPEQQGVDSFNSLVTEFMASIGLREEFVSSAYGPLFTDTTWKIYCPCCFQVLDDAPVYLEGSMAFTDRDYISPTGARCACTGPYNTPVDHDRLRYRQLLRDATSGDSFFMSVYDPSITVMFNTDITKTGTRMKSDMATAFNKLQPMNQTTGIYTALNAINKKYLVFARSYVMFNLIHCTLPQGSVIQIHEDLVSACLRQERFSSKMNEMNWFKHPFRDQTVGEAIIRYSRFMTLLKLSSDIVVPTLDIDLAWHTHQLSQQDYFSYCHNETGKLINHDDKFEETKLSNAYEKTCKLYKKVFKDDYSICHCFYCSANRRASRSFFKKSERSQHALILAATYNSGHISSHNGVTVGTKRAQFNQRKLARKYNVRAFNRMPWYEREPNTQVYVVPYISLGMADPSGSVYSTGCDNNLSSCGGAGSHSSDSGRAHCSTSGSAGPGSGCGGYTCGGTSSGSCDGGSGGSSCGGGSSSCSGGSSCGGGGGCGGGGS